MTCREKVEISFTYQGEVGLLSRKALRVNVLVRGWALLVMSERTATLDPTAEAGDPSKVEETR